MRPVYMVLYSPVWGSDQYTMMYGLRQIIKVIACDVTELEEMYARHVAPLQNHAGPPIYVEYYVREPDNPFRDQVAREEGDKTA